MNSTDLAELLKARRENLEQLAAQAERMTHHHVRSGDYHRELGKRWKGVAEHFGALHKEAGGRSGHPYNKLESAFDAQGGQEELHAMHHTDEARKWKEIEEACTKVLAGDLNKLSQLEPTQISAVYDPSKGTRPVIRAGQREIGGGMPAVDPQFSHLVKVGDDRDA